MYEGRRILAVIPARGGSKGVPLKNLREVGGVPIVGLAAKCAGKVAEIDRTVVSTDHDGIAAAAEQHGADARFRRPDSLSGDRIGDVEVLAHALSTTEQNDGTRYDVVVMLQPTSPLRRPEDVRATIAKLVDEGLDAVWTVSETDSKAHPLKQLTIDGGSLGYYDPHGAKIVARQQLEPVFHRNGVAYALTRSCLLEQGELMGEKTGALVIDGPHVSIDTEQDFALLEFMRRGQETPG